MTAPTSPASCPGTSVQRGNSWAQTIELPATDSADNPLTWGTFTVDSPQVDSGTITLAHSGTPPTVVLSLTAVQTAAISVSWVHWYLTESTVMGGNRFLTGRIALTDEQ